MANHKSALKRARQNIKRNARNRALRTTLRNVIRKYRALLTAGDMEGAQGALPGLHRALDRAVTKGIVPKNTASRQKSRLTVALGKAQAA